MRAIVKPKEVIVNYFLEKGILVSPDFLSCIDEDFDSNSFLERLNEKFDITPMILTKDTYSSVYSKDIVLEYEKPVIVDESKLVVVKNYDKKPKKKQVSDFVEYFKYRYNSLKNLLVNRPELNNATSINRILNRTDKDRTVIIGIVMEKFITKNGNIIFTLEDLTGSMKVIVTKNKKDLFDKANDVQLDEVIGIIGMSSDKVVFVNDLIYPDIPISHELKKSSVEEYAVFTSDMHVGGELFFEDCFLRFISWLNGEYGSDEHKKMASKVKYLFICGDLVEGVGIYPGQEEDLIIEDIYRQYEKFTEYVSKIRSDLKIVIIGGNHDALRMSEPQPEIDKRIAGSLYELENITFVSNPSVVNIGASEGFEGFDVLLYHGGSFPYLSENVDSIRKQGRMDRPDLIMKYLLQRRHLAVSHTATLYVPGDEDFLVIDKVPDFFVTGHIHKTMVSNYRNVTTMNCSCWTGQTENMAKRGIVPNPNRVVLVNLQTRDVKILNFEE